MATLVYLPVEVAAHILTFLSGKDLGSATCSCQLLRAASEVDSVWQKKCYDDFKVNVKITPNGRSCKDIYTHILHKHGQLLGLWQIILEPYGGLCYVTFEDNRIAGYEYMAPSGQHIDKPLRKKLTFTVDFTEDDFATSMCHKGRNGTHDCRAYLFKSGNIYYRCPWREDHEHPAGPSAAFAEWAAINGESLANMFVNPDGHDLQLMKFLTEQREDQGFEGKRMYLPKPRTKAVIQPGLFKGTYGAHGTEIILLEYDDENNKIKCTKITGDPNVPSTKETIRVDLSRPMILSLEQQESIQTLAQIDIPDSPPDVDIHQMPSQKFRVPHGTYDRSASFPTTCSARFHSQGQIAGSNFNNPKFIPGHFVVFDENTFGHLWIELHSFSLYSRVQEDFSQFGSL